MIISYIGVEYARLLGVSIFDVDVCLALLSVATRKARVEPQSQGPSRESLITRGLIQYEDRTTVEHYDP